MRSFGWTLILYGWCLLKGEICRQTHTREDGCHVKMKAEIGVMLPNAKHTKDWSKPPRAEGESSTEPLRASGRGPARHAP